MLHHHPPQTRQHEGPASPTCHPTPCRSHYPLCFPGLWWASPPSHILSSRSPSSKFFSKNSSLPVTECPSSAEPTSLDSIFMKFFGLGCDYYPQQFWPRMSVDSSASADSPTLQLPTGCPTLHQKSGASQRLSAKVSPALLTNQLQARIAMAPGSSLIIYLNNSWTRELTYYDK